MTDREGAGPVARPPHVDAPTDAAPARPAPAVHTAGAPRGRLAARLARAFDRPGARSSRASDQLLRTALVALGLSFATFGAWQALHRFDGVYGGPGDEAVAWIEGRESRAALARRLWLEQARQPLPPGVVARSVYADLPPVPAPGEPLPSVRAFWPAPTPAMWGAVALDVLMMWLGLRLVWRMVWPRRAVG